MPDETLLTLRQLADELHLPESTVRYYRDAFLDHIPSVGTGRRRRYPAAAVAVLRQIASSYAGGRSRAEIVAGIHGHGASTHPVSVAHDQPARSIPLEEVTNLDLLAAILDGEREQRDALWQMAKEIVRLTEVLEGQDAVLNEIADKAGVIVAGTPWVAAPAQPVAALAPADGPAPEPVREPSIAATFFTSHLAESPPAASAAPAAGSAPTAPLIASYVVAAPAAADPAPPAATRPRLDAPDIDRLRAELESERALVERLREAKLQIEHRAADAEAELADRKVRRPSVIRRLLGSDAEP